MALSDFPPELLATIFSYLSDRDICNTALTCKSFQEAIRVDSIWQAKCHQVLQGTLLEKEKSTSDGFTSHETYTKLLKKYGFLVGTWQPERDCYGGLISVKFSGSSLTASEYRPPRSPNVLDCLRQNVLFTVTLTSRLDVEVVCHTGYNGKCRCTITEQENGSFHFKCAEKECHTHPDGEDEAFQQYLWDELDKDEEQLGFNAFVNIELLQEKFNILNTYSCDFCCNRIKLPGITSDVVIQPGLFKGVYGSHGIEIVCLDYDDQANEAVITKITGDPNVFANKISIRADLKRPMTLTLDQQQSVSMLKQIDIPDMEPDTEQSRLPRQPFVIPQDCYERETVAPRHCTHRFHAKGQVAGHRFTSPSFIPSHWIIFDENCFGNIWLNLKSFSIFYRIQDEFL